MTRYHLFLHNATGVDGNYGFFGAQPTVTNDSPDPEVYTNVWLQQQVPANGTLAVTTTDDVYAWVGKVPTSPAPGVIIESGVSALATLGTPNTPGSTFLMVIDDGAPTLGPETMTAHPAAFEIDTGTDVPVSNHNYLIGMGKADGSGLVGPTGSALAGVSMHAQVTPKMAFYIGESSSYEVGTIVDFQSESRSWASIDFSAGPGAGQTNAIVTHNVNGSWAVIYEAASKTPAILDAIANDKFQEYLQPKKTIALHPKKLADLQSQVRGLSNLLASFNSADESQEVSEPLAWIGKVRWPSTVAISTISLAAVIISNNLTNKHYSVSYTFEKAVEGSKTMDFQIKPNLLLPGQDRDPVSDWAQAVAADPLDDQHEDLGIEPENEARIKPASRVAKKGANNALTARKRQAILNGGA